MRWIIKRVMAASIVLLMLCIVPLCIEAATNPGYDDQLRGQLILTMTGILTACGVAWLLAGYCRVSNWTRTEGD